jgi:SAM-dependent methyltransferase
MATWWNAAYTAESPAPWDTGRPQPAFARLAEAGRLTGSVLDIGCGTGEHALLAARHGADAVGVDVAPAAPRLGAAAGRHYLSDVLQ